MKYLHWRGIAELSFARAAASYAYFDPKRRLIRFDPYFAYLDPLRGDSRYAALVKKLGLPA